MRRAFALTAASLATLLGCSDRPVPERQPGDGMSGDVCADDGECVDGAVCFNEVCVQQGLFRVSLSWSVLSDFDLHVITPGGNEISYAFVTADGGTLDVDDCVYGVCSDPEGVHVENIFFDGDALPGTYKIYVVNFDGLSAGQYTVEVAGAINQSWMGELPALVASSSLTYQFEYAP